MRHSSVMFAFLAVLGLAASSSCSADPEPTPKADGFAGSAGLPGSTCQQGYTSCVGQCVNTAFDFANCGSCGSSCGASQTCFNSMCQCVSGLTNCAGACINTTSSATNCGTCGNACLGTQVCSQGTCANDCATGELKCGNSCVQSLTDSTNCGACGVVCGASQVCTNGACNCTTGTRCGGECIDISASVQHCGGCGQACGAGQTCNGGVCAGGIVGTAGTGGGGPTAGAGGVAAGGAVGTGGASGASGASGTGGSGNTGGMSQQPTGRTCPTAEGLIADFEEKSADVLPIEGRLGRFEGYGDAAGQISVTVQTEGATACNQGYLQAKGSGFSDYVGVAAVLKGTLDTAANEYIPSVYDASAFTGISFRAKRGSSHANPVRFGIATPWTEGPPIGSVCNDTDPNNKCWNHLGHFLIDDEALTDQWKTFSFCFDRDFYPLFLPSGATTEQRRQVAANLLKLQFQFNQSFTPDGMLVARAAAFDFHLDDVKLVKTPCDGGAFQSSAGTVDAFGTNANVGTCAPATDAAKFNKAISQAYARWKTTFVNPQGGVVSPEQNKVVSEGIAYGMLITAAMGDKATFDLIWGWGKSRLQNGLLGWDNGSGGSATDADTDMGYALLMAAKQWGGTYQADGTTLIAAARSRDVDGSNRLLAGDSWSAPVPFNPSYFSPGFYRAFGSAWTAVTTTNYGILDSCDQQFSGASDGLVPDWCSQGGAPEPPRAAVTSGNLCPQNQACYTYDAARTPWRIGFDACMGGGTSATAYLNRLIQKIGPVYQNGARIDLMKAGWGSTGQPLATAVDNEMAFIGPMGIAAMASSSNAAMRDRAFRAVLDIIERPEYYKTYYSTTLGILTLLMMSGNWPVP